MKCHQCGQDLPETAKFCRACGVSQRQIPATQSVPMPTTEFAKSLQTEPPKCSQCGDEMLVGAKFCRSCGAMESQTPAVPPITVEPIVVTPQVPIVAPTAPILVPSAPTVIPQAPSAPVVPLQASIPNPRPVLPTPKSKALMFAVIGLAVLALACGVGYWGWMQKKAAEEQVEQLTQQRAEEQKRKADEEQQQKLKETEDKGRKEAEENARQEAAKNAAAAEAQTQMQRQAAASDSAALDLANRCDSFEKCFIVMLAAVSPHHVEAIQVASARIIAQNKVQRGDRKVARGLNDKGLEAFRSGDYTTAIDLFKQGSIADPLDVEIQSNLALVALRANRSDVAQSILGTALSLDPRRTSTWIPTAEYFAIKGDSSVAERALLLAYEFSTNKEKSLMFFKDNANTAERIEVRAIYKTALEKIEAGQMN